MDFIKNPIFLAIVAGVGTYYYLYKQNEDLYKKLVKKNPNAAKPDVDFTIPAVVAIIVLFLAYSFIGSDNSSQYNQVTMQLPVNNNTIVGGNTCNMPNGVNIPNPSGNVPNIFNGSGGGARVGTEIGTEVLGSHTLHLIGKDSIKLPHPDVFIDLAKF